MKDKDNILTEKLLKEIQDIRSFIAGMTFAEYACNTMAQKAVVMSIINIGELSKAYSETFRERHSCIPWKQIQAMRNIAAHQYGTVSHTMVWDTITTSIPELEQLLRQ